jgi:hypothetical protein
LHAIHTFIIKLFLTKVECTGNSMCANGYCICPNGEPIVNKMCVSLNSIASPGEPCAPDVTRCTGNSACLEGRCTCPHGQVALNAQCATVNVSVFFIFLHDFNFFKLILRKLQKKPKNNVDFFNIFYYLINVPICVWSLFIMA